MYRFQSCLVSQSVAFRKHSRCFVWKAQKIIGEAIKPEYINTIDPKFHQKTDTCPSKYVWYSTIVGWKIHQMWIWRYFFIMEKGFFLASYVTLQGRVPSNIQIEKALSKHSTAPPYVPTTKVWCQASSTRRQQMKDTFAAKTHQNGLEMMGEFRCGCWHLWAIPQNDWGQTTIGPTIAKDMTFLHLPNMGRTWFNWHLEL